MQVTNRNRSAAPDGPVDKRWQGLAQLSGRLIGLSDDAEILRVALADVFDLLDCDAAEVVLHPFAGHSGLVARVEARRRNGAVWVAETSPDEDLPSPSASGWQFSVPLTGSPDPIGTLTVGRRCLSGRCATKRLTSSFALLLASALAAGRTLAVERTSVEDIYQRVMLDGLTSLGSRSLLIDRGDRALLNARAEGKVAALLLFDVDDFKRINDTLGHHAGDRVLAEFGLRLRRGVRSGDLAVRLGGDEFAVLTGRLKSADDAASLVERLLETLSAPIVVDDIELSVRSSAGIAVSGEDGDNVPDLLRAADLAMYAAKGLGTGRWQRYSPSTQALADRRSTLTADLRRDSFAEQLVVHYQPQVDAWSGQITGFESLACWAHPQLGLLPASEFVLLAERAGLASRLTTAVLDRVLAGHPLLQDIAEGCSVSVNISSRNLLGRGLVSEVARLLAAHDVRPELLTIEVTEPPSGASPGVTETLNGLGRLGCRVSVSEFGTGSSSLMALSRYEGIRELKLDSGLVAKLIGDPTAERLVRAIIGTAHALEVPVVAEGVESHEMVTHLRDLGCDVLQGRYVQPPAGLEEIWRWADGWPGSEAANSAWPGPESTGVPLCDGAPPDTTDLGPDSSSR